MQMNRALVIVAVVLGVTTGMPQSGKAPPTTRPVIRGSQYAIASMKPQATQAAERILHAGGNAFDAAVAGQAVLGITDAANNGVGSDAVLLIYDARSKSRLFPQRRGDRAPAGNHRLVQEEPGGQDTRRRRPAQRHRSRRGRRLVHAARSLGQQELRRSAAAGHRNRRERVPRIGPDGAALRGNGQAAQVSLERFAVQTGLGRCTGAAPSSGTPTWPGP